MIAPTRLPLLALTSILAIPAFSKESPPLIKDEDTGITLREGFDAELLYTVPKEQGSWVAMSFDLKGRLVVSDQDDKGVFRVTLPSGDQPIEVESMKGFPYEPINWGKRKVGGALGFLHAFDSLYMVTMTGLYRCRDTNGDDSYDDFELLKKLQMGYEHSAHSIIKTEDGKGLYLVSGNYGTIPKDVDTLQPPVWQKDSLLEPMPDQMGHAVSIKAPGGWVSRISPDGNEWTMIASGFRNPVDLAINLHGELFTFDSDLEFDVGSPWYRPTRICHVTSASEFGWRNGSAKWREYFADSNGPALNVGPGSPTGISFGHHSSFPTEYQDKLFVCDWTFGTIYLVTLKEEGASYSATKEEFLHGNPLNITAMRFGPDGHMYFLTGGRNTDSKLYRIRSTGTSPVLKTLLDLGENSYQRNLRRSLEKFHGTNKGGFEAIDTAWPHLAHEDRSIRYAARLAIENQDLSLWQPRVLNETNPRPLIYGAIALARHGQPKVKMPLLERLKEITFESLPKTDQLALLRAYSLCFIRLGKPSEGEKAKIIAQLDPPFPANDDALNAELCRVLSYLEAPRVVSKTMALMKSTQAQTLAYDKAMLERSSYGQDILKMMSATPNSRNIHYTYCLRRVQNGWSLEDRKYYFGWLNETLEKQGGKSFAGYIRAIRQDAIDHLPDDVKGSVSYLLGEIATIDLSKIPTAKGPGVAWTTESAMKHFEEPLRGRDFENGKEMFSAGLCIACHRFAGTGGYSGPDLGSVGNRYSIRDIIVAICEPDQSISEQYQASEVTLKDGSAIWGRLIYQNEKEIAVASNALNFGDVTKKPASEVVSIKPSQRSMMLPGMINSMNPEELKDLLAYLVSSGNPKHEAFQKP